MQSTFFAKPRGAVLAFRPFAAALLVAAAGVFSMQAWAEAPPRHAGPAGAPMMGMPWQGRMLDRMLDNVKATPEQRTQIQQITRSAATDLKAQREAGRSVHEQAMQLFTQPTVDANAAEALRQQTLAQHDQASRRVLQAMLDISRVLTPEQRQQLAQRMQKHQEMAQRHMRERANLDGQPAR